jgi:tryptophan-rich sensory protein
MEIKEIGKALAFILICNMAGIIGSVFTFDAIPGWYATLAKPDFSPPNWVFGPVWTTLYTLMGIAAYLIYRKGYGKKEIKMALTVFGGQLVLNALWSILFFGLQSPMMAFICIIILLAMILWCIRLFWSISKAAALLMVPYALWVSFATVLNYSIWMLNP